MRLNITPPHSPTPNTREQPINKLHLTNQTGAGATDNQISSHLKLVSHKNRYNEKFRENETKYKFEIENSENTIAKQKTFLFDIFENILSVIKRGVSNYENKIKRLRFIKIVNENQVKKIALSLKYCGCIPFIWLQKQR
jgi:hypothetical protein